MVGRSCGLILCPMEALLRHPFRRDTWIDGRQVPDPGCPIRGEIAPSTKVGAIALTNRGTSGIGDPRRWCDWASAFHRSPGDMPVHLPYTLHDEPCLDAAIPSPFPERHLPSHGIRSPRTPSRAGASPGRRAASRGDPGPDEGCREGAGSLRDGGEGRAIWTVWTVLNKNTVSWRQRKNPYARQKVSESG